MTLTGLRLSSLRTKAAVVGCGALLALPLIPTLAGTAAAATLPSVKSAESAQICVTAPYALTGKRFCFPASKFIDQLPSHARSSAPALQECLATFGLTFISGQLLGEGELDEFFGVGAVISLSGALTEAYDNPVC